MEALFERRGEEFEPTRASTGPWDPGLLHGGPPAMLLAREIERVPSETPVQVVRLTVELLRPVTHAPLTVSARLGPAGRSVQRVEASLRAGDREVVRAVAVRMRVAQVEARGAEAGRMETMPPLETMPSPRWDEMEPQFGNTGIEARTQHNSFVEIPGASSAWFRMRLPVVAGEEPSPLVRACAAADFGNGISAALNALEHLFVNPDLTINLFRQPRGEWVGMRSRTQIGPDGAGLAVSELHDQEGPLGTATQTLFVEKR